LQWIKPKSTAVTTTDKGQLTEQFAQDYLVTQGLIPVDKNYHCRNGELDLIMLDGDTYVFIEVKYRKNNNFGGAVAAISPSKQKKIKHCVTYYLHHSGLNVHNTCCRVDVVTLEGLITQPEITWLKNAF
jgi:putative endonuclease